MASSDSVIQGLFTLNDVEDRLKKYAQDKKNFQFWVIRQVTTLSLLKIISEKFGTVPTGEISDWKFKYNEMDEIPYQFYVSTATTGTMTQLSLANNDAAVLTLGTRILVHGLYTKSTVSNAATDISATKSISAGTILPEIIRVVAIGNEDSGGSGYALVTVKRGHPADSYTGTPPAITTSMQLTVSNVVVPADSKYQPITNKTSKPLENLVQITRKSYGVGEHMTKGGGIETYLSSGSEFLNTSYTMNETFITKVIERAILTGRKAEKSVSNKVELETGGILEFIPRDTDHYIDMKGVAPSIKGMNALTRRIADIAGVSEMWMFTGTILSQQMADCYEDGRTVYTANYDLTVKYQVKINTIESTGRAMILHHVTAPVLNEIGMANEALFLNLTEMNWNQKHKFGCFQIAEKVGGGMYGFDDLPKDADSYESNTGFQGVIRELYGAFGLVRRLPETHFIAYNWYDPS